MSSAVVYKSNALIESAYRLSVLEQRIVLSCIAQVRRDEVVSDQVLYKVSASDIAKLSGRSVDSLYSKLKAAAMRLMERKIWIHLEANGSEVKQKVLVTRWVQSVTYSDNAGEIELRFAHDVLPYVSQLKSHFTRYRLAEIGKMDSAHAIRLFEILVQYKELGQRDLDIDDLREALMLNDKYSRFAELKRRVIIPALEQINEHSSLIVDWSERKAGRKIVAIVFTIEEKETEKTEEKPKKKAAGKKVLSSKAAAEKLARPGETYAQLYARLRGDGYTLNFDPRL